MFGKRDLGSPWYNREFYNSKGLQSQQQGELAKCSCEGVDLQYCV